jgi:flavorubredoxin
MHSTREIANGVHWVGASDRRIERFENLFPLSNGVAYNAYMILDDKTALLDTVDNAVGGQLMANVAHVLGGRPLDYLIINHMEPDHCASIGDIVRRYPEVCIVGNEKTFAFLAQYYGNDMAKNRLVVAEGQRLSLGARTLQFFMTPMVHWPEVMMTYEEGDAILFSADAFGAFGAHNGNLFADEADFDELFLHEARRYYANIVGRYGAQVQAALKKLSPLPLRMICPLHGPIWRENIEYFVSKYDLWSRYAPETPGVVLAYASMYGNTASVASALADKLAQRGVRDMRMYDASKTHASHIIADAWKYSHLVVAAPTYNMGLYPPMEGLLRDMAALGLKNRKAAVVGNHTWASAAAKRMQEMLEGMKGVEVLGVVDVRSALHPEREHELDALAEVFTNSVNAEIKKEEL